MILNLSNFIYSLLLENETVIIPGFGAFISTYKPAEIGENEIQPPTKEISFSNQIKTNDGLLVEIIARKAKISQANAFKRIEKARENMLYELDKGNTVILENIGILSYNDKNEIEFEPVKDNNLLVESFGFEAIPKEEKIKIHTTLPKEEKKTETNAVGGAVIFDVQKETGQLKSENTETKSDKPDIEGFKLPEFQPAPAADKEEEKKKKFAWYWFLLLLIPIFIGVYFVIFNQSQSNKSNETATAIPEKIEQAEEKPELISEDTAKKDTLAIELPPVLETKATEEPNTVFKGVSGKYYLIRGGFEDEENVKEYMRELQAEGVESFVVGKTGRLILVGIEEFSTEDDAMKALNQYFKTKPDWKLWVYKVK